jgi:hypothetical protein
MDVMADFALHWLHGHNLMLPAGQELNAYVDNDLPLQIIQGNILKLKLLTDTMISFKNKTK